MGVRAYDESKIALAAGALGAAAVALTGALGGLGSWAALGWGVAAPMVLAGSLAHWLPRLRADFAAFWQRTQRQQCGPPALCTCRRLHFLVEAAVQQAGGRKHWAHVLFMVCALLGCVHAAGWGKLCCGRCCGQTVQCCKIFPSHKGRYCLVKCKPVEISRMAAPGTRPPTRRAAGTPTS